MAVGMAQYTHVIFDFGGVITASPFEAFNRLEAERGLPRDFVRGVNARNPDTNAWALFERAEIDAATFDTLFAEEARAAERLDAKLKIEAHWLERGVTARRKRNQGRLEKLYEMRAQRAAMLTPTGNAKLGLANDDSKTKSVIVAEHVTKRFGERTIIKDFSLRIQRGDRIGVVGSNGAGKSTLLKLLTGEIAPDEGIGLAVSQPLLASA